jgi:hypothetical protein
LGANATLSSDLRKIVTSSKYADAVVIVKGMEIPIHLAVLASHLPECQQMFVEPLTVPERQLTPDGSETSDTLPDKVSEEKRWKREREREREREPAFTI